MLQRAIESALKQRFLVLVLAVLLVAYGVYAVLHLPVDAFPDVTNVQVQVNTESPGLAAVEVEQFVTFPIEAAMSGLPGITDVRSMSKTGLSVVTIVFRDDVDVYFARQLVLERLQVAREEIPDGLGDPELGPITTGLGQIYKYVLESDARSAMDLRTLNDWTVKFQLRTVPGVTDVLSFGGEVRQYQVRVDPTKCLKYDLTLNEIAETLGRNNRNAGGWYLDQGSEQFVIRGTGLIRGGEPGLVDIGNVVVKSIDGTPVYVRDIAEVGYGGEIRQGAVTMNGRGEVVAGIVLMLKGANTKDVIERVEEKIASIQKTLPQDVRIVSVYDQADLVAHAVRTVTDALLLSVVLIVVILFLFLWNVRSALLVVLSIPLSILIAVVMMNRFGVSANLMSLGGLAIGIGMMVDGSVVMVENIFRHRAEAAATGEGRGGSILHAAREVASPVFFAVLIIVVVFLPLFTLQGVEGKLFKPLAFTISFAMLGSILVALTVVPVLATYILQGRLSEKESFLMRFLHRVYSPVLGVALRRRFMVLGIGVALLVGALAVLPRLGSEFVPELEEGTLTIRVTMNPSVSLEEAKRISTRMEKLIMRYPEVTYTFSQIGRAELGGDPEGISNNEIFVGLKPISEWKTVRSRGELVARLETDLSQHPGILLNFSQPIATRVDELLAGVKAQIAVKLFGEDLGVLERKGREIESVIRSIPGARDVALEAVSGEAQIVVAVDRDEIARFGVNVDDVMNLVSNAIGGQEVTEILDGQKRFAVYLRLAEANRKDIDAIRNLLVSTPSGARVPLSRVASVEVQEGPPIVSREAAQRRVVIQCNVRDRDLGGFVKEGMQAMDRKVRLPEGYYVVWGGQFENQQRAQKTLAVVIPLAILLIFVLLYLSFGSVRNALLILLNVPFAMIGGIWALYLSGQYLSVPSSVGFIALFGVAVLNGVVLVSYINQLRREGLALDDAIRTGCERRLRPVLMTATAASLGLIPLLLSHGIGSEVQRPLATVVVGGLFTSTLLTLVVLPTLYKWFERERAEF
jgi:cobalt-zinc-cadmium resistance protein CzcA